MSSNQGPAELVQQKQGTVPPAEDSLSPAEAYALQQFRAKRAAVVNARYLPSDAADLSASVQMGLFRLYLAGLTLPEIRERNQHLGLGQIVSAAVEGKWAELRVKHLEDLFGRVRHEAEEAAASGVEFVALAMRATHKRIGDKLLRYLQTDDETALDGTGVGSLAAYRVLVDMLSKMTGQDQVKKVEKTVTHHHEGPADAPVTTGQGPDALAQMAAQRAAARKAERSG